METTKYIERKPLETWLDKLAHNLSEPPMDKEDEILLKQVHDIIRKIKSIPDADVVEVLRIPFEEE